MLGPEIEVPTMAAAWVSLPLSTGVFQLDDFEGLGLAEAELAEGEADGVADAEVGSAVGVGSDDSDAGLVTRGATVTNWVTAGCGAWTGGWGGAGAGAGAFWVSLTLVGSGCGAGFLSGSGARPGCVGVGSVGTCTGAHVALPSVHGAA